MKDGSRFSELIRLKDEDFFQKHRTAYLYFPDGKRRTLRPIAALTAGSQGNGVGRNLRIGRRCILI